MKNPKDILREHDLRPRKRLGQSFLSDPNILRKIVGISGIERSDTVVEIGAGLGILTALIAGEARRVIALEVDRFLVPILRDELRDCGNVDIVQADVLAYDFAAARPPGRSEKVKVIGNIPYNISSQIVLRLLQYRDVVSSAILMFQKEVAERLTAMPGTKAYGILSVLIGLYTDSDIRMSVSPSCFYPEPKVTSSVLRMSFRERPLVDTGSDAFFRTVVRAAFSRRRKTLLNNLKASPAIALPGGGIEEVLEALGIDAKRRAETLSASEFGCLSRQLLNRQIS